MNPAGRCCCAWQPAERAQPAGGPNGLAPSSQRQPFSLLAFPKPGVSLGALPTYRLALCEACPLDRLGRGLAVSTSRRYRQPEATALRIGRTSSASKRARQRCTPRCLPLPRACESQKFETLQRPFFSPGQGHNRASLRRMCLALRAWHCKFTMDSERNSLGRVASGLALLSMSPVHEDVDARPLAGGAQREGTAWREHTTMPCRVVPPGEACVLK